MLSTYPSSFFILFFKKALGWFCFYEWGKKRIEMISILNLVVSLISCEG